MLPDAPTGICVERTAEASGALLAMQFIRWWWTDHAATIQSVVFLDRWNAVCVRSVINVFVLSLVLGVILVW